MNLSEALEELRGSILRDKSSLKNGPPDSFWTDAALTRYIDDAHSRFARMALCIRDDTTPAVTQVVLASATDTYLLHPSVMMVLSARHEDDQNDLSRIDHKKVANTANMNTDDFDFASIVAAGKPLRFTTDEGLDPSQNHAIRMRFVGVPDSTQTGKVVYLRVIRKPLKKLTLTEPEACFETPEDYDLDVLEWAAWRALRNWDLDAEDRTKAVQHKDRFDAAVIECKRDVLRKIWQPVKWRFGGGGFSYIK